MNNNFSYPYQNNKKKFHQKKSNIFPLPEYFKISSFENNGNIDPLLVSGEEKYTNSVKKLAEYFSKGKMTSTQMRRYYDEAIGYDDLSSFESKKIHLQMLFAKVAYSVGRGVVPQDFLEFLQNRVDLIESEKDFQYFLQHFEALVAWCKYYKPKDK